MDQKTNIIGVRKDSNLSSFLSYDEFSESNDFKKRFHDLKRMLKNLEDCGKTRKFEFHCKHCKNSGNESLIYLYKQRVYCDIRYCFNPYCINERFARQLQAFKELRYLKNLRNLWHFSIGFKSIPLSLFKKDFSRLKKRYEVVLSNFWIKLKSVHRLLIFPALRVLDFSFEKEGYVNVHFHYGAVPLSKFDRRLLMILVKDIEKDMNSHMRIKTPFLLQSHGIKKKEAIFCYLAKRSAGLYKYGEGKNFQYSDYKKGKLVRDIKDGKYLGLKDFLNEIDYYDNIYFSRASYSVGGLPHACIPVQYSRFDFPFVCNVHGELNSKELFVEVFICEGPPD